MVLTNDLCVIIRAVLCNFFFGLKVEFVMTQMKFKAITAVHNVE
jgi:hypothetical protein